MEDTTLYAHYGALMKRGLVPYLNFKFEYPPLSLPLFLIPGWIAGHSWHAFEQTFELMMLACGMATVGLGAWLLARENPSPARLAAGVALGALTPLLLGPAGASLWLAAHQVMGLRLKTFFSHGSDNLYGHPPTTVASIMTIVQWVAIVGVWITYALGRATRERLLLASAATVCAFLFLGRVLSPQYLIWLVPLVMVAPGRLQLKEFQPLQSWAAVARSTVVVVLLRTLAWPDAPLLRTARGWLARWRGAPAVGRLAVPEEA
ncbi:MAG TPA: hypothetical protein VGF81_09920 [Solirubrobacteraceae bacterium]